MLTGPLSRGIPVPQFICGSGKPTAVAAEQVGQAVPQLHVPRDAWSLLGQAQGV